MQKPTGYDETQAAGEYTPVELGGHYCQIKQVTETKSNTGKDMIVVILDFCQPDKQAGFFTEAFNRDTRDNKKWPIAGRKYIMVNDYADPKLTSRQFKGFCEAVEKSNNYAVKWGSNGWGDQFKGKKVGAVYGEEESEYNGETHMRPTIKFFCDTKDVPTAKIPKPKYLKNGTSAAPAAAKEPAKPSQDFMNIPDDADEDIPF